MRTTNPISTPTESAGSPTESVGSAADSSDSQPDASNSRETWPAAGPDEPMPGCVAIIGLGLLGGSVAMAIRQRMPATRVTGCARRDETRRYALLHDVVTDTTDDLRTAVINADLVVVATPVDIIAETVIQIAEANPDAVITDVGSTKSGIVSAVGASKLAAPRFAAAHPIAGSEKTGVEHAVADLFVDRPTIVTPSLFEDPGVVDLVAGFWRQIGANVSQMPAEEHDRLLAISSHMPHLMASLIARQLPEHALPIVGTGWLGTTRIAAGDPSMWGAIVAENRSAIVSSLRSLGDELEVLVAAIEHQDQTTVATILQTARAIRLEAEPKSTSIIPQGE